MAISPTGTGRTRPDIIDAARLREVVASYPTGVTAVAAVLDDVPVGMAANSFTSVSLEPPLVSVCVAHSSSTWPTLARAARIGISVLGAEQHEAGRQLAAKDADRFAGLSWRRTDGDAVLLDDAAAWLETSVYAQHRAGDHDIIVLQVHDLDVVHEIRPLVFHASRFGRLAG